MCTTLLGSRGSFDLIVIVLDFGPALFPVSTLTLMTPALPGRRTFGKSTAVHPQLGATDSMFKSLFPVFLTTRLRTSDLPWLTLPKSMLLTGRTSLGDVGLGTACAALGTSFVAGFAGGLASGLSDGRPAGGWGNNGNVFGAGVSAFGDAEAVAFAFESFDELAGALASLAPDEQPAVSVARKIGTRRKAFIRSFIHR